MAVNEGRAIPCQGRLHLVELSAKGTGVMRPILQTALVLLVLGLAGCAENKYPVTGETCGPEDPVRQLDANDCVIAPGI
jgi:hypothetical protein